MQDRILLAHGSGGKLSHDLIGKLFLPHFDNPILARLDDSALIELETGARLAFTTDSYVVSPLFFPGGDIGKLATCGTINDLSMSGAKPLYMSASFIIEEGFPIADLKRIVLSMRKVAEESGVKIVAGDTKVVGEGAADGIFVNTTGLGLIPDEVHISGANAQPGDMIMVSGTLGDHGIAIMSQREGLEFASSLESDCAPLQGLVARMLEASLEIHCLRDPTRGGLATTLNEMAAQSQATFLIEEKKIPVREEVQGICELLGLDLLYLANEGKLVAVVPPHAAGKVLEAMRGHPYGKDSVVIGRVLSDHPGRVIMKTTLGAHRLVEMAVGELLPRIC
ncbi:MAG: hydrogenase expression/formation protein HypE [Anaerolineae bacterium]